jgi:hypothetical protein
LGSEALDHWGRSKHKIENVQYKQLRTEQIGTAVTLQILIREVLGSNSDRDTGYPDRGFRGFQQSLPENVRMVPRLGHYSFLPISHPTIRRYTVSMLSAP